MVRAAPSRIPDPRVEMIFNRRGDKAVDRTTGVSACSGPRYKAGLRDEPKLVGKKAASKVELAMTADSVISLRNVIL